MTMKYLSIATGLALGLCAGSPASAGPWDMCGSSLQETVPRPSGKTGVNAVVFERTCEAGKTWNVSLVLSDRPFEDDPGNVLVADAGHIRDGDIKVRWLDRGTVEVTYKRSVHPTMTRTPVHGFTIVFVVQ
jgi:hypothetical protein